MLLVGKQKKNVLKGSHGSHTFCVMLKTMSCTVTFSFSCSLRPEGNSSIHSLLSSHIIRLFAHFSTYQGMLILVALLAIISGLYFWYLHQKNPQKPQSSSAKMAKEKPMLSFDSADVMTNVGPGNTCVAIFKNPSDHKTHFYRTRLKSKAKIAR